jgi:SAM-dependent methyltransferase
MSDWSAGYVTEVGYIHGYYQELLPLRLGFACLAKGVAAPGLGAEPIRVLELGCGQGLSANIIAAANPQIDYTAIDFNPEHTRSDGCIRRRPARHAWVTGHQRRASSAWSRKSMR